MSLPSDKNFLLLTTAWARQVERVIAEGYTGKRRGDLAGKILDREFGGAIAVKMPGSPWRNGVFCFSHAEVGQLGEIMHYFQSDGVGFSFFVAPMGFSEGVGRALAGAGFFPAHQSQAILHGVPLSAQPAPTDGITVEAVTERSLEEFVEMQVRGFAYPADWQPGIKEGLRKRFGLAGYHPCLARYRGEPVGSAILACYDGYGYLADAAVIPAFRGKGCHAALLQHRLHAAGVLGCKFVVSGAEFGSASFRNQLRAGLHLTYIETTWQKC